MTNLTKALVVAGMLATGAATAVSAETVGQMRSNGESSANALRQLIAGTGLSVEQATSMTLDEVVAVRWQDD